WYGSYQKAKEAALREEKALLVYLVSPENLRKAPLLQTLRKNPDLKQRLFNPNYALASTPSVSIIGGMGDTSKASTHPPGAPTFWLCTPTHRASTHLALSTA
ncbi:hypothetical protein, partial [Nitratifractor sp.]